MAGETTSRGELEEALRRKVAALEAQLATTSEALLKTADTLSKTTSEFLLLERRKSLVLGRGE